MGSGLGTVCLLLLSGLLSCSKLTRSSDLDEFASLIASGSKPDIETLSEKSFDPRSQYSDVIKAVRAAVAASDSKVNESDVEVKVYRVEVGHSRVEYWVIALDGAEGKIVGLRAKAIES